MNRALSMPAMAGTDPRLAAALLAAARAAGGFSVAIGSVVLLGWALDIAVLKTVLPGLVSMKANTALGFVLAGLGLRRALDSSVGTGVPRGATAFGCGVAAIGGLTLSQYLFGWNLGIDQILFTEPAGAAGTSHPGRMAPNSALGFGLVGASLLLLDRETRGGSRPAQQLALGCGLVALLALVGYGFGVRDLVGVASYTQMALHTAVGFLALAFGLLFARPERGLTALVVGAGAAGIIARRLLLATFTIPAAVMWLRLQGERAGLYGTEFGASLIVVVNLVLLAAVIWWTARSVDAIEAERRLAEAGRDRLFEAIREAVGSLGSMSAEILAATTQQAAGTAEEAAAVQQTAATVEQVKQTAQVSSEKAQAVAAQARRSADVSQHGRQAVEQGLVGIQETKARMEAIAQRILALSEQAQAIGDVIATIGEVAEQSNLLAVNAAIEAAKAGEAGRGFSVVAQEVKALAEQSKQATAQVRKLLVEIQRATQSAVVAAEQGVRASESGVGLSGLSGDAIRELADSLTESAQSAQQIFTSAQQQAAGLDQIALSMRNIQEASGQNLAATRQVEQAVRDLDALARRLRELAEVDGATRVDAPRETAA